jgi:hypothetical protein
VNELDPAATKRAARNRYGLPRDIPNDVARQVRQRDGFGCVICGNAFYTYDHFDPEFVEAEKHDPHGICLLCGTCHRRKTSGLLSTESVKAAVLHPKCKEKGFSWGALDVGNEHPEIILGSFTAYKVKVLIKIYDEEIFSVLPPENSGGPFRINARLTDPDGRTILEILENELRASSENWDVELVGPRITVRLKPGEIILILRSEPPLRLVVERLQMQHRGTTIQAQEGHDIIVRTPNAAEFRGFGYRGEECAVGIQVSSSGLAIGVGCSRGSISSGSIQSPAIGAPILSPGAPGAKLARNAACWCGSGLKFKRCHGRQTS